MGAENRETVSAFYARVRGRVQGVGFRYSTVREAHRLRISGWVRNASNGDVEVWAEGPPEKLAAFLGWLRKGPQFSRIDSVDTVEKDCKGYYDFNVEY
ncbi:MAG: acylphosphatase [Treponema sp.]|nr:acylphosphatase [Treponema sp.]